MCADAACVMEVYTCVIIVYGWDTETLSGLRRLHGYKRNKTSSATLVTPLTGATDRVCGILKQRVMRSG